MEEFRSKYTGSEVEERLDRIDDIPQKVSELDNDVGYLTGAMADKSYEEKGAAAVVAKDVESLTAQVNTLNDKVEELKNNEIVWTDVQ